MLMGVKLKLNPNAGNIVSCTLYILEVNEKGI